MREKKLVILGSIGLHMEHANGEMGLTVGGRGYDLSLAFARMQESSVFGTAVHQGSFSDFILLDAEEHNIQILVETNPDLEFAGTIHSVDNGQEYTVHVAPVFSHGISDDITHRCLEMAKGVILECAFTSDYIHGILDKLKTREAPLFLIGRTRKDVERVLFIPGVDRFSMMTFLPTVDFESMHFPETMKVLNFAPDGKVGLWTSPEFSEMFRFETSINEACFVFLVASVINQSMAWKRTLERAVKDCRLAMEEYVRDNLTWISLHSIDRKFSKYFKHVENLEHDFLTGLKTRGTTDRHIEKLIHDLTPFSIFLVDIDHFKSVNDTWGHDMGDLVLAAVAREIGKGIRASDICGRWGGEEFIVVMPNTTVDMAFMTAERIRQKIQQLEGMPRQITASFGLAQHYPGGDFSETLNRSDKGLYYAKRHGRNQVVIHTAEMDEDSSE